MDVGLSDVDVSKRSFGWELFRVCTPPDLLHFCESHMPASSEEFRRAERALKFVYRRRRGAFYRQLLLTVVALSRHEKKLVISTITNCVTRLGTSLSKILKNFKIGESEFDANKHLIRYLESSAQKVDTTDANLRMIARYYNMASRSTLELIKENKEKASIEKYAFDILKRDPKFKKKDADFYENRRRRAIEKHGFVIDNWDDIHFLAEKRYLLMRQIMLQFRKAIQNSESSNYPITFYVSQGKRAEKLKFLVWDMASFLDKNFEGKLKCLWKGKTLDIPFVEYCGFKGVSGSQDEGFWCAEVIRKRYIDPKSGSINSWHTIDIHRALPKKSTFDQKTHKALMKFFKFVVGERQKIGKGTRCLFDPNEIYGDILIAQTYMRMVRSTGARIHEIAQIRVEPAFFYERWGKYFFKVSRKGKKQKDLIGDSIEEIVVTHSSLKIIETLVKHQRRMNYTFRAVKPGGIGLDGLSEGKYILNDTRISMSENFLREKIYFLLYRAVKVIGGTREDKIYPHGFRYGFINRMLREGFEIEDIAKVVGHIDIRTTLMYGEMTNEQSKKAKIVLDEVFALKEEGKIEYLTIYEKLRDFRAESHENAPATKEGMQYILDIEKELELAEQQLETNGI